MPNVARVLIGLSCAAGTWFFYRYVRRRQSLRQLAEQHGCKDIPRYPHQSRFGGLDLVRLRDDAVDQGRLMALFEEHFARYGKTFEENFVGLRRINTMHSKNIQQILTTSVDHFRKNPPGKHFASPFQGDSLTTTDGELWKYSRNLVKPIFTRAELSDIDGLGKFVGRMIDLIPQHGEKFDIQPLLHKMFLDISTEFLFGESMDSLLPDSAFDSDQFLKALDQALSGAGKRFLAGKLGWIRFIFDRPWRLAYEEVHAYIDEQVRAALDATSNVSSKHHTLESNNGSAQVSRRKYILLHEMAKEIRDPIKLRYQILGVFIPARDTSSILVGNALFHLARNPKLWTGLRETSLQIDPDTLTFETLKSLTDFRYILWETLRLQGPSGRILRYATRDTVLPQGGGRDGLSPVLIPRGASVAVNFWGMHHDPDLWGPDVQEFKPERWIGRRPLWEFAPFSGGPRICPANQQVLTHAAYTLVRLTREFRSIENRDPVLEYVELAKMTTSSRNGVRIGLRKDA